MAHHQFPAIQNFTDPRQQPAGHDMIADDQENPVEKRGDFTVQFFKRTGAEHRPGRGFQRMFHDTGPFSGMDDIQLGIAFR